MNDHHSDPSAPKPQDPESRPALAPETGSASGTPAAAEDSAAVIDEPTADDTPPPQWPKTEQPPSTGTTATPAEPGTTPAVAATVGEQPESGAEAGPNGPRGAEDSGGVAATGGDSAPEPATGPVAAAAGPSAIGEPGPGAGPAAPPPAGGSEPVTRAAPAGPPSGGPPPAGPFPPRGPQGPRHLPPGPPTTAFPAGPPHAGPPTGQIPMVGPSGHPVGGAPAKPKSKAPMLIAAALVLALGAGAAGGVAGYALAAGGDTGSSSPSEQVADGNTISDIAKKVQPSVVSIATENAGGSGVVIDDDGHIITNNHVAETASGGKLEVSFADGSTAKASVVGTDPAGDLAVIKVDGADNLTPIEMGDSGGLDVGDTVLAIGSPLGLDGSVTSGIVSALDRTVQAGGGEQGGQATTLNGLIQTDAAINPGNSGGALVNGKGELIGINTVIATAGASEGSVGLGFAIPSDTVASTAEQLKEGGDVEHGYLGVSVVDNVSGSEGAVVNKVEDGSPAADAGLERGDIITAIDGNAVTGSSDVGAAVQSAKPGTKVDIKYTRDGKEESTTAELGSTGSTG